MASGFHGTLTLETLPLQCEKKSWFPLPDEIENSLYEKCIQEDLLDNGKLTSYSHDTSHGSIVEKCIQEDLLDNRKLTSDFHDTSHGSIISKETMSHRQWHRCNAACDGTNRWSHFQEPSPKLGGPCRQTLRCSSNKMLRKGMWSSPRPTGQEDSPPPGNGHVRQNDERWKRLGTMAQAKVEELQ